MISVQLVLCSLVLYAALQLTVGLLAARRSDNATFFTASRRVPWQVTWGAMISAAMSGITFVSVPAMVAEDGFSYLQMVLGFTVGQLIVAHWLVPLFYRWQYTSIYEYFGDRFGPRTHRWGAWFFLLSKFVATALKLYLVALVMQVILFDALGVPLWANALLTVVVAWGYTRRGGVKSLLATDLMKTLLMILSVGVTLWAVVEVLGYDLPTAWRAVRMDPMSRVWYFDDPHSAHYFWKMFLGGVVLLVAMTGLDQELMQRNLACRTVRDAQKNIYLTALCQAIVIALFLVLGALLYRYAEVRNLALTELSDGIFPQVAVAGGLPGVVGVLFVAGFAAAGFSSAGAAMTALTTSISVDIMRGKELSEKRLTAVRMTSHAVVAVLLFGAMVVLGYGADERMINLVYRVAGYTYGPILGLFLFGLWTGRRVRDRWSWLPMILAPLMAGAVQLLLKGLCSYEIGFELLLLNAALVMAGLWLVSRRTTA